MSFFLAVKKSTDERLEMGTRNPHLTGVFLTAFRQALCVNNGIDDSDLSVLVLDEASADAKSALDGAEFNLVKTGSEVTGLDFTPEISKRILKVNASKSVILANGSDSTTITIELWKADDSGIATSVDTSADMPIRTPDGAKTVRVTLTNGVFTKVFSTTKAGVWVIPSAKRIANVRIGEAVSIESIQRMEDL